VAKKHPRQAKHNDHLVPPLRGEEKEAVTLARLNFADEQMIDKTFLVRFKPPALSTQPVIAAIAEIRGEHLVLLNAEGKLAALFLLDLVESWVEVQS